jgi:hypothetical protein
VPVTQAFLQFFRSQKSRRGKQWGKQFGDPALSCVAMPIRVADIAEYLAGRCRVYDDAFAADLRRLRAAHGASTVVAALRLLDQHADQSHEHKQAVREGVARTLTGLSGRGE